MKIIVKNNNSERQSPEVTIDTSTCQYTYAIREALWLAIELDGYDEKTIKDVFNRQEDVKTEPQAECAQEQKHFDNDIDGYWKALQWVTNNNLEEIFGASQDLDPNEFIQKANELWKQQNQTA